MLEESADGGGRMVKVILRPDVRIGPSDDEALAESLHDEAHRKCFIAASVNFPVVLEPAIRKSDR